MRTIMSSPPLSSSRYDAGDEKSEKASSADLRKGNHGSTRSFPSSTGNPENVPVVADCDYPEGGYGWAVVVAAGLFTFTTFGYFNSWVIFQAYYQQHQLKEYSPSAISWIGSTQYGLLCLLGIISGRFADRGYVRSQVLIGSVVFVATQFLIAEATEYWQLMLGQGIALGFSATFMFFPAATTVPHYFQRKIGAAQGVFMCFGAVGSIVLPIFLNSLFAAVGYKWTMRILGFILLAMTGVANLLLKTRLPPNQGNGKFFNFSAFKSTTYSLYVAAITISFFSINTVGIYIQYAAMVDGIDPSIASYLVSISNAGAVLGRMTAGPLCDYSGPINILIHYGVVAAATTYAWPHCKQQGSAIAISVLYGIFSGGFEGLICAPAVAMAKRGDVGQLIGMMLTLSALAQFGGPPIAGVLVGAPGGFYAVAYYSGSVTLLACLLLVGSKYYGLRSVRGKY
ncbi:hypothetical protein BOTBODRAFT_189518 [Botryobasidium botryosum FD-172 SS1]|uniref:Major facilitator superfamily (MFS) profile domain-containing protein n=1 Tax=Botryobasidium botryosum (strain FD-172 SS1) TaxID=930990 RepID=A0A067M8Z3_BOTB1|nr:hypothetical protein BOTBODRAFT_189518 [Botryobasidium botryosum FD-172 SS1]